MVYQPKCYIYLVELTLHVPVISYNGKYSQPIIEKIY